MQLYKYLPKTLNKSHYIAKCKNIIREYRCLFVCDKVEQPLTVNKISH